MILLGYQPTFETKINDYINAIGVKFPIAEGWSADASVTYGSNDVDVTVNNSVNRDYLSRSMERHQEHSIQEDMLLQIL